MSDFFRAFGRFTGRLPSSPDQTRRRSFVILFCVLMSVAAGNTAMQSVLPAIGREIGIRDTLIAAIFTLSAVLWTISAPFWAKQSDHRGRKPMIMTGLIGFGVSMLGFALVVLAGLNKLFVPMVIFAGAALTRAVFGLIGSASNPAAQAYVADRSQRSERTGALATLASAFGLGTILGPAVAPLFILPGVGLAGPMFAFAVLAFVMTAVVQIGLPNDVQDTRKAAAKALAKRKAKPDAAKAGPRSRFGLWRDPRMMPFIIYGFLVGSAQAVNGQTLGFLIIDKLKVSPAIASGYTGVAMMAGAVAGLLAQWGLIRMLRIGPRQLMRWGAALAALGNVMMAFAPNYATVVSAFALASLGYGFCRPGFTAGASLAVDQDEQGEVAGAITAVNGACYIFAPVFGVWLYETMGPLPYGFNVVILLAMLVMALQNGVLKNVGEDLSEPDSRLMD
jgi:MFS family permease